MSEITHILGPPGTGKSRTITEMVSSLVKESGPESVMVLSLTKAAATEIASREHNANPRYVGTMHSICKRIEGMEEKKILDTPEGIRAWNEWSKEYKLSGAARSIDDPMVSFKDETSGDRLLSHMNLNRHRMVPVDLWSTEVRAFNVKWNQCMTELNYTDFTGLIEAGLDSIWPPGAPQYLFGDEAQDWSKLEAAVFHNWVIGKYLSPEMRIKRACLAGDGDQAIFDFRAANPRIFLDNPTTDRQILGQSHRVPRAVYDLARRIIKRIPDREDVPYLPTSKEGSTARNLGRWRYPQLWINDVLRKAKECEDTGSKGVMVLASCGYMLEPFLRELRERCVPFGNPYRIKSGKWNPMGAGADQDQRKTACRQVLAFMAGSEGSWSTEELRTWLPLLRGARRQVDETGAYLAYGAKASLGRLSEPFPAPDEYLGLFSNPETALRAKERDLAWLLAGVPEGDRSRLEFSIRVLKAHGPEYLKRRPVIIPGTVHSVKGGEAAHVFLITALPPQWSVRPNDPTLARLFYVGATRASESVTLITGDPGGFRV